MSCLFDDILQSIEILSAASKTLHEFCRQCTRHRETWEVSKGGNSLQGFMVSEIMADSIS